jgi:hypothetical protein
MMNPGDSVIHNRQRMTILKVFPQTAICAYTKAGKLERPEIIKDELKPVKPKMTEQDQKREIWALRLIGE